MTLTAFFTAGSATTSRDLYRRALRTYSAVWAASARFDDPDLGMAISGHLGHARLALQLLATPWGVSVEAAAQAERLLASAPIGGSREELFGWLETFPAQFAALLDRRARETSPITGGRRAWDRVTTR